MGLIRTKINKSLKAIECFGENHSLEPWLERLGPTLNGIEKALYLESENHNALIKNAVAL